ncbi:MAG TPA: GNAT family N-acetyltransferase [Ktedonobacterales bacterium]
MVTLRPMTEDEFAALKAELYTSYPEERARATGGGVATEEEIEAGRRQVDELMAEGLQSTAHHYWKIVAPEVGAVGVLWVMVDDAKHRAFIYFISTDAAYRGRGYGQQALEALEAAMRPLGVTQIALNVWGDNHVARRLYERVGYQPQAIYMTKDV